MVGELPVDGECSVCGGKVGIIEEEIEKDLGSPGISLETWEITKCLQCGHIEKRRLLYKT